MSDLPERAGTERGDSNKCLLADRVAFRHEAPECYLGFAGAGRNSTLIT